MMKKIIIFMSVITSILLSGCSKEKRQQDNEDEELIEIVETTPMLPDIVSEELYYKHQDPFGEVIPLTGEHIIGDTAIFSLSECEMIIKDNMMIMKNYAQPFRIFSLPDLKQVKTLGRSGQGPDEYLFPTLVPTEDTETLCYIYEATNQKLYAIDNDSLKIKYLPRPFKALQNREQFGVERNIANIGFEDFIYVENSKTGKSIFRITQEGDSAKTTEVFNLGLNPKRKSPFAYIGSFAAQPSKNRMAYAYKYFKIIKFMDLEAQNVRTINFEKEGFDDQSLYQVNGLDQNVSHYWKAFAGEEYVYFLYIGRTPYEVGADNDKENYYTFIEQYDWNGNPIKKYKLDQWGYFTIDEQNKKLYLASTDHDDPFFVYQLP